MHPATQEVERRVADILKQNPSLYGRRVVLKAVQAQVQIELLHDISAKLDRNQEDNWRDLTEGELKVVIDEASINVPTAIQAAFAKPSITEKGGLDKCNGCGNCNCGCTCLHPRTNQ